MAAPTPSLWHDTLGAAPPARPPLPGDTACDVAVVGGGFTGLWTAYELAGLWPSLRIVVLEADHVGFGASGRNGGWCSALVPADRDRLARRHGDAAVAALTRAVRGAVDAVGAVVAAEGIDCGFVHDGTLVVARSAAQEARLRERLDHERRWGSGAEDLAWLGPSEARARVDVAGARGGLWTPHCAAVHPARLVTGLAAATERRGVHIHERTRALELAPGRVRTEAGTVRADVVVRATEGYTPALPGLRRRLAPVYSLMIATEPLDPARLDALGWVGRPTVADGRWLLIYAQRTADGRVAFGGRGAPYPYGSQVRPGWEQRPAVFAALREALVDLFPALDGVAITHAWGGPLGVPRDGTASVGFDRRTGMAWAGGYTGDGVATSNLAGRTLAALISGKGDPELTRLPWVGHASPSWEPEPLRWLGINAGVHLAAAADRAERSGDRAPSWQRAVLRRLGAD